MQDYNYVWHGCMDITIEMSCCKYPPADDLPKFWEDNKKALVRYLGEVHRGVRGFVKDERNAPVEGASLKIKGRDVGFQTTKYGEYWRVLLPGRYAIEVYAEGFEPREEEFDVVETNPTLLNLTLYKAVPGPTALPSRPQQQMPETTAGHRIDQQRRPVYVGGPSQQQGAAPQPQGGIGGFLSSIGDSLSNVFSMFG
ncbi:Carboxypeptidase M [Penaeus vannamei]|uniref:Carboxypeptidase M n=2 Tax=Penaeus vannamei TaxID=6689 RepID=A0A423U4X1_PENVA|nr:Carboxypeptidase M [Penaeus vannamei]